jgi:hypothetical protein
MEFSIRANTRFAPTNYKRFRVERRGEPRVHPTFSDSLSTFDIRFGIRGRIRGQALLCNKKLLKKEENNGKSAGSREGASWQLAIGSWQVKAQ